MNPCYATALEVTRAIARGEVSIEDLASAHLKQISAYDFHIHAVTSILPLLIKRARDLDRARGSGAPIGELHGLPIVLKDNIDVAGFATTSGCRALAGAIPKRDSPVVQRLKVAGALLVAKTNLSEFSFEIRSRSSLGGDVRNPFALDVTAGGSSGGAAAAVAAGFAAMAVGTDTGGSIRTPASFNGLVGLRPSLGLIDRAGVAPLAPSTDTVGVIARTVADAERLLRVIADPGKLAPSVYRPLSSARIGVARQAFGSDREIIAAMTKSIGSLKDQGVVFADPVFLPEDVLQFGEDHVVDWEFGPTFDAYLRDNFVEGAPRSLRSVIESGEFLPDYADTLKRRAAVTTLNDDRYRAIISGHRRLSAALDSAFDEFELDALLYPTSAVVPTSLENPKGGWAPELAACSGRPAITLPVACSDSGIPIGLELLGRRDRDEALIAVAAAVERVVGRLFVPELSSGDQSSAA